MHRFIVIALLAFGCSSPEKPIAKAAPSTKTAPSTTAATADTAAPASRPELKLQHCGLSKCHGLDVHCVFDAPQMCTDIYMHGDFCRAFAQCRVIDGACTRLENPKWAQCTACMAECKDQPSCDQTCRAKLGMQ